MNWNSLQQLQSTRPSDGRFFILQNELKFTNYKANKLRYSLVIMLFLNSSSFQYSCCYWDNINKSVSSLLKLALGFRSHDISIFHNMTSTAFTQGRWTGVMYMAEHIKVITFPCFCSPYLSKWIEITKYLLSLKKWKMSMSSNRFESFYYADHSKHSLKW